MAEELGRRNEVGGAVTGTVVQSGSIHHVTLAGVARSEPPPVPPRQLPLAVRDFVGRYEQLAALDALLSTACADGGASGAVVISAVDGLAGVGKTALAVHWAHRVQDRFPGGTLYVDLGGYGPGEPATPGEVLDGFLRALHVMPERIPIGVEARAGLFRSLLTGRRMLIVLDNANSAEQVRPLLPGSQGCMVLVASRDSLMGLVIAAGATRVTVTPLAAQEAVELVDGTVGRSRAEAEADAVRELTRLCDRLPLALRIAGSLIAARPHLHVADVVAEMRDGRGRLDALSTSTDQATAVRAVFGWSYQKLAGEHARLFRRLGLHPGTEIGVHAAAAVAGLTVSRTRRLLGELAEVHLIEPTASDRYRLHDLLRAYAAERVEQDDSPEDRGRAVQRLMDWYAHTTAVADRLVYPAHLRWFPDLGESRGGLPAMDGRAGARSWLVTERANLIAAIRYAAEHDMAHWAISLVHSLETCLYHDAYWDEVFEVCALGIAAADRVGDRASHCWFLNRSGWARLQVSGWDHAVNDLHRALTLARSLDNPYLEAYARNDLGMGCLRRNSYAEALEYLGPAISLSRGTDSGRQEAFVLCNVSSALAGLGQYHRALEHAERSLVLHCQAEDHEGTVFTLNQLARIWQQHGDHAKAIALCEDALAATRDYAYLPDLAATLDTLGSSLYHTGDTRGAEDCWLRALEIYNDYADHRIPDLRTRLHLLQANGTTTNVVPDRQVNLADPPD
ncbi:tetratricopeptide repeat protein [Actinosynnema sp. NPDC023587]|uniref:ATP-binding protein n=1 Tax=Actinosynnema sp. NPDC023587 TaxID=3154695 RepID=UPI0033EAB46B